MKPKIVFACAIADDDAKRRILKHADVLELSEATEGSILDNIEGAVGLIVPYTPEKVVTKQVLDRGSDLEIVGTTYGGVRQNVEDEYAIEKGLLVIHTGASRPRPMAEYTLCLVLSALMQIHNYNHYMKSGEAWPRTKYPRSRILHNRVVGIVGFGRIARGILDVFRAFTDRFVVYSRHLSESDAKDLGVEKADLSDVFRTAEVVILAGGYTPDTHHMVGKEQFAAMQEDALFVNIARGKMVDEQALIEALSAERIYAALDVFEEEPLPSESPLRNTDRTLITPHRANNPVEFEDRWQCLAEEFEAYFRGDRPESALTLERARAMSDS